MLALRTMRQEAVTLIISSNVSDVQVGLQSAVELLR